MDSVVLPPLETLGRALIISGMGFAFVGGIGYLSHRPTRQPPAHFEQGEWGRAYAQSMWRVARIAAPLCIVLGCALWALG